MREVLDFLKEYLAFDMKHPFKLPKQENATNNGMLHFSTPNITDAKL